MDGGHCSRMITSSSQGGTHNNQIKRVEGMVTSMETPMTATTMTTTATTVAALKAMVATMMMTTTTTTRMMDDVWLLRGNRLRRSRNTPRTWRSRGCTASSGRSGIVMRRS